MNIPIEPKKDGYAVSVDVQVPTAASNPRLDREATRSKQIAEAIIASYREHLEALRATQPNPEALAVDSELWGHQVLLRQTGVSRYDTDLIRIIVQHGSSGYYAAKNLASIALSSGRYGDRSTRRYDLTVSYLTTEQRAAFDAGERITLTVTANWSKIWAAVLKLYTERVEALAARAKYEQAKADRQREAEIASQPVAAALKRLLSTPPRFEGASPKRTYGADAQAVRLEDGTYRFSLSLGKDASAPDSYTNHPRLPVQLARRILDALVGTNGQVRLTLDHLTAEQAANILALLPQQDEVLAPEKGVEA